MTTWNSQDKLAFLIWKEQHELSAGVSLLRRQFLNSDDLTQNCAAFMSNLTDIGEPNYSPKVYSKGDVRDISQSVERDGAWTWTQDQYQRKKELQKQNLKKWGTSKGLQAIDNRNAKCSEIFKRKLSQAYKDYIAGEIWKERANKYLRENCAIDGKFICELCGKKHAKRADVNVHHNTYGILNGSEPDQHLCAVCRGRCHQLADVARYTSTGVPDRQELNDALRPLLQLCGFTSDGGER